MSQVTDLTANDASAVAHIFRPLGCNEQGWWEFEQYTPTPANALAAKRCALRIKRPPRNQGMARGTQLNAVVRIEVRQWSPVMETLSTSDTGITPPATVAYVLYTEVTHLFPERSTENERVNHRNIGQNLVTSNTIVLDVMNKLAPFF